MDCKEFEKLIPDFIARKTDYLTLKRFCEHIECCEDCKEELTIKILVTEGIHRLEDGSAFDLQAEMRKRLEEAKKKIQGSGRMLRVAMVMELLAICLLVGIGIMILL